MTNYAEIFETIKQRTIYHIIIPVAFIFFSALIWRYGEIFGGYCGHVLMLSIISFFITSIMFDHKEDLINLLFWNLLRICVYIGMSVLVAIFLKEIKNYFLV